MRTRKATRRTRTQVSALVADLAGVLGPNLNDTDASHFGLVLDKELQLIKRPVAYPIIHPSSSLGLSYSFEVFHHYFTTVKVGDDVLADIVVHPSHPTSFPTAKLLQESLSRSCAFSLELSTQVPMLPFYLLNLTAIIKPAVRCDGEVVYSEINAQNTLRSVVLLSGSDLFREGEQEEASAFLVCSQKAFLDGPREVFSITSRNVEVKLLSAFEQPKNEPVSFQISTSWEVIPDRSIPDGRLGLCLLNNTARLLQTSDSELCWEPEPFSDNLVNFMMKFDVVLDAMLPGVIIAELQGFSIPTNSADYLTSWIDSYLSSNYASHTIIEDVQVFKAIGGESVNSSPQQDCGVSSTHEL